jgi:glycosyltransferase involved in cell wall biosynthesis
VAAGSPAVSVILPTLDRLAFLRRAIGSALAQTYGDLEVVVVVDGPSPELEAEVGAYPDPRVRLVRRAETGGVAAARNTGLEVARGRYVGFLDDDDLWLPEKLERQVPLLDAGADVVHSLAYVADGEGNVYERPSERGFRLFREVAAAGYPYPWLLRRSSYQIGTFLVRSECVAAVGGFDPDLPAVDDLDLVHRLWRRYRLTLVDEPLTKYCFHGANWSYTKDPQAWISFAEKELAWIRTADPPGRRESEAYLLMQIAQAEWIRGRYRRVVAPAARARALDASAIGARTLAKYAAAAVLPARVVARGRQRVRAARPAAEPDPWLDLPTPLPDEE